MKSLPTSVGNAAAQKSFIEAHEAFLREFPDLQTTIDTALTKSQEMLSQRNLVEGAAPPQGDALAGTVIFFLCRAICDDFEELLLLAGNALGLGATKVLRCMYERLVTAMYIGKHPDGASWFRDQRDVEVGKLINRYETVAPELLAEDCTPEQLRGVKDRFSQAKARQKEEFCKKCNQPMTTNAWTKVSLDAMALEVDIDLHKSYATCYLQPTFLTHATPTGLDFRIRFTETGHEYKLTSAPEARNAVFRGHFLILKMLRYLNEVFALGIRSQVDERYAAFDRIWSDNT